MQGIAKFLHESVRAGSESLRTEMFRQVVVDQVACLTIATLSDGILVKHCYHMCAHLCYIFIVHLQVSSLNKHVVCKIRKI